MEHSDGLLVVCSLQDLRGGPVGHQLQSRSARQLHSRSVLFQTERQTRQSYIHIRSFIQRYPQTNDHPKDGPSSTLTSTSRHGKPLRHRPRLPHALQSRDRWALMVSTDVNNESTVSMVDIATLFSKPSVMGLCTTIVM